ncbi:septin-domain-containing protein [Phanerochaete sordida]|uniref:Septin-domain-containing protein n=1 Tax=Phanerochaete sordida TaxID=48140 RepID=A0A9P3GN14_9APHY|nr:septin-domain-containing protein [Phanerochaete sordida]
MLASIRRKYQKKQERGGPPYIRASPSLPELHPQGIPWPEDLIDAAEIPKGPDPAAPPRGSYARPAGGPISTLYTSHPPSAFDNRKSTYRARNRPSQRRSRDPTSFNIMVVGAQGTGKTSLLRLLLETAEISPNASPEQRHALDDFLRGAPKRTQEIHSARIEICESKHDRLLLSVIDTPGLDFRAGHELSLERQVSAIVRHMDTQFAETLNEESKVVRQSKGDNHVHLCIYTIDPSRIVSSAERRSHPSTSRSRSESTVSSQTPTQSPVSSDYPSHASDDDAHEELCISPADLAVMRRLVKKTNLLPVIARADTLTDDTLEAIKRAARRDLETAGLDLGVFVAGQSDTRNSRRDSHATGNGTVDSHMERSHSPDDDAPSDDDDQRRSRPAIKLRGPRTPFKMPWTRSRSRTRIEDAEPTDEPTSVDTMDTESVASVRFSARTVVQSDLTALLPFAFIAPETTRRRRATYSAPLPSDRQSIATDADPVSPSEDSHADSTVSGTRHGPLLQGPPADLRGVFVRKYRWGTIDVLSPEHCDFAALRTTVLSTHMKMLKIRTKEVLYERYRTEKLLARRATKNISEDQARKMVEGMLDSPPPLPDTRLL